MKVNQKNKTRIGISLLCAIILLTGCHITPNKKQDGEKKKYPKLVVVYSGAYGEDSSFSQVQEEINKITRKKLGVEVEFHLISDSNYSDAVELMLTSGEQVDILWGSNSLFVKAYVNRQLCDLEPLLKENGKDIIDAVGWKYINCCRIGGTLYGLPNNRDFAAGWDSYALRKDILNKYNIKASDIKNIKDLEKVFDLVLEKENGVVPLACTGSLFGNFSLADGINSLVSGGHENYGQEDEVDDMDSFMRLMLYSNEMDIAGLILSSSTYHYAGGTMKDGTVVKPYRWTGTKWASEVLDNYAKVYPNLRANAKGYPEPDYLKSILKIGNIKNVGDMEESTDGSNFLKDILLDNDNRTLYIQTWGGTNTTARALYDIEQQYKDKANWKEIYNKVCDKAVIYIILNQDDTFSKYIAKNWPDIKIIQDGGNFWRFAYMWKRVDASLTTRLQGKWYYNNIAKGHGALLSGYHLMGDGTILDGELDNEQRGSEEYLINNPNYNRYDFISEGDSPSFFYLLDTGLRSMEDPTYGGWGGRFGVDTDGNYRNIVSDKFNGKDDTTYTLTRWFDDIQDDFAARADWCISSDYSKSNHRPTVKVREGIDLTAKPGERIKLHADATDPDGDRLDYNWWQYYEADTYSGSEDGEISMVGKESDTMSFVVPEDAQDGDTIHMVITVKDDGAHNMTHYQRVIVKVQGRQEINKLFLELPEEKDANAIETGSYSGWSNPYAFTITAKASNKDGQAIANKTMTWESSDEAVGTISSKGVFTPKKAGKTTITATANDGSGKTATIELTVVEK